jgi:hypothetical protein
VLGDQAFEMIAESASYPIRILRGFDEFRGHRIAGNPELDWPIIDGVGAAPRVGSGVRRIAPGAHLAQIERALRFEVVEEYRHDVCEFVIAP